MADSLYLLDGHAQIYRAYYAPFGTLTSPTGEPTRATHVFFSMIFNLIRHRRPTYLAMAIDLKDSSQSRRRIFADYKATREPPPDDLPAQIDRIIASLAAMGVPILSAPGYEADDVLASMVKRFADEDLDIYLVSKDKDLEQLIYGRAKLYDPGKDLVLDAHGLETSKGYPPDRAIEVQTLMGDNVDNIPGISGVGLKTAAKLIKKYGTADAVVAHAHELTPKMGEKVRAYVQQLPITRQLVTLVDDLDISFDLNAARVNSFSVSALRPIFDELGFTRLQGQIDGLARDMDAGPAESSSGDEAESPATPPVEYELIDTTEKLKELEARLAKLHAFAFDTETTGLNPVASQLVGISFSWKAGQACYVPVRGVGGPTLPLAEVVRQLGPVFENPAIAKCGHNIKFDLIVLAEAGFSVGGVLFDTLVASFLLDPLRQSQSMDWLAQDLFGHRKIPITDILGKGKQQTTMDNIDIARVCEYAAEDADYTWRFFEEFEPQIVGSTFERLFRETEMPMVEVLAQMERNGVALDVEFLQKMGADLDLQCSSLRQDIHKAAGRQFNIDSTKQLALVLFDEQNMRVIRKTKTGRSTDVETLTILARETDNPLPPLVLQYRELIKLKNTYTDSLPKMICNKTGRIHASYNIIGAVTGRLSSSDPNLQNIPIRTELGREIRKAFITSGPDQVLLSADYSQIELRLLAHYCRDEALCGAFVANEDIHRFVAAQVFGVEVRDVTSDQRSRAKAVNFGIIYGQTPFGLSRTTGMNVGEAREFIDRYFDRYPGIRRFIDACIAQAEQDGYVETMLGRRRPIPELRSRNKQQRMLGERLAVNTVLQGSAADLIKTAMINIHRRLMQDPNGAKMLIQVHDELVFEVHRDRVDQEAERIREEMCNALPLGVPLVADTHWGPNWLASKSE